MTCVAGHLKVMASSEAICLVFIVELFPMGVHMGYKPLESCGSRCI